MTYTNDSAYFKRYFSPVGEYEKWLLSGDIAPWREHLGNKDKAIFKKIVALNGGFDGPVKSYKSLVRDVNAADESGRCLFCKLSFIVRLLTRAAIPDSASKIQHPVLLITATDDTVGIPDVQIQNTKPYAYDLRVRPVDAGHFLQLEAPDQVSSELQSFFEEVLGRPASAE